MNRLNHNQIPLFHLSHSYLTNDIFCELCGSQMHVTLTNESIFIFNRHYKILICDLCNQQLNIK